MKKLIITFAAVMAFSGAAQAWWIFGSSAAGSGVKYLYINGIPADEAGGTVKLFTEALPQDGAVKISGRAYAEKGPVGKVRLTLDSKNSWQDVKFSGNGNFEYSFKPETGKSYTLLVEVTDAAGKTSDIEKTRETIEISAGKVLTRVRIALDTLFDSYNRKNLRAFMAVAGENFAGGKAALGKAVERDFKALSNIILRYTLDSVAAGAQDRVFVSLTFNRLFYINKTGASHTDSAATGLVFNADGEKLSLYSMKQPLLFGLSDAENVAAGAVSGGGAGALMLDDSGNLATGYISVPVTDLDGSFGYALDDGTVDSEYSFSGCGGEYTGLIALRLAGPGTAVYAAGAQLAPLPGKTIGTVTLADVQGITGACGTPNESISGKTYGIKASGKYYALEVGEINGSGPYSASLKVKSF